MYSMIHMDKILTILGDKDDFFKAILEKKYSSL